MQRVLIHPASGPIALEVELLRPERTGARLIVFLHEGLGSLASWGDWARQLCDATGCRGLVFSRFGYGRSQSRSSGAPWPFDYMEIEAREHLPALFRALGIDPGSDAPILLGHSDGGTIALHYAAAFPQVVAAIIVLAPHVTTEAIGRDRIARLRQGWHDGRLRARLAQSHADPEGVFIGWSECWLAPGFRDWNITEAISIIACPVLAVQGRQDQYASLEQIFEIERRVPQTEVLVLEACRHIPHEDQAEVVRDAVLGFLSCHFLISAT